MYEILITVYKDCFKFSNTMKVSRIQTMLDTTEELAPIINYIIWGGISRYVEVYQEFLDLFLKFPR